MDGYTMNVNRSYDDYEEPVARIWNYCPYCGEPVTEGYAVWEYGFGHFMCENCHDAMTQEELNEYMDLRRHTIGSYDFEAEYGE